MFVQQQRVVDNMIKYLETVENRTRELEKRGGIPTAVPGRGSDLPRDPASELLLRRVTTWRTAAEGGAAMEGPMESAPYGPPHPTIFGKCHAGGEDAGKRLRIGTSKRAARIDTV